MNVESHPAVDKAQRPLLGLVAIVKDEADNIARTIASVAGVCDSVLFLDTGSTDGTQDVIRRACQEAGIPLHLHEEPFIDFAASRNRANELYEQQPDCPEFLLMLSGDETLEGGGVLRQRLDAERTTDEGAFNIGIALGPSLWHYTRVLRARAGWRYVGVVHEVPLGPNQESARQTIPGVTVVHTVSNEEKRTSRLWLFDKPKLESVLADPEQPPELHANALFLLGQTCDQIANVHDRNEPAGEWITYKFQAMSYYRRRAEMEALFAEINGVDLQQHEDKASHSIFTYYRIANELGLYDPDETLKRLEPLVSFNPKNPALRYTIATMASRSAQHVDRAIGLCVESAEMAAACKRTPLHIPFDTRIEWLSYLLAIECSKHVGKLNLVPEFAQKGLDAGGPADVFAKYLA